MTNLFSENAARSEKLKEIANRYAVSMEAVIAILEGMQRTRGRMAQFTHRDLGGMGQWSQGMLMIGDFGNSELKARVQALCDELARFVQEAPTGLDENFSVESENHMMTDNNRWWPSALGAPSAVGAQNMTRYAYFPETSRLAVQQIDVVTIYDTGQYHIYGVAQSQGEDTSLTFDSQLGRVTVNDLAEVDQL